MAAAGSALRLCLRTCRRAPAPRMAPVPLRSMAIPQQRRTFTTTLLRRAEEEEDDGSEAPNVYPHVEDVFKDLTPEQLRQLEDLVKENDETGEHMAFGDVLKQAETEPEAILLKNPMEPEYRDLNRDLSKQPTRGSFWYDETDEDGVADDLVPEFQEDDMTTLAHGKLDEIREYRHYARIAAWEMPLLSKLAKPFSVPTKDQVLRFRYTTYMGEFHPAEKKVVVEFSPADLGLTAVQADKLRKLAGPRYNPTKDVIKMSCESFGQPAQNKRYLSDLVDTLITEAKDPKDTFEDIPLDTRHHVFKSKPKFPKEWRMTPERKAELEMIRQKAAQLDAGKEAEGQLVDGAKSIDLHLNPPKPEKKEKLGEADEAVAELVAAVRPGRGAGRGDKFARR